ncbi:MAG: hypothetical protein QOG43_397 [Actinomycetota bacterium]|jgi:pyruvyl transferase EpsO|nr:hypothetical protein [Actinomycetota bacterium]
MRRTLSEAIAAAIPSHRTCALLMFRDCENLGDAAIWLGALNILADLGIEVRYSQPLYELRPDRLRRAVGDGPVLINGGGSFGDLYLKSQRFMMEIIGTFGDRPIVVLPQTVFFRHDEGLEDAKRVLGRHPDLTLFCRDHRSYEIATTAFDCSVVLTPDLAVGLAPLTPMQPAQQRDLWVLRRDGEARGRDGLAAGAPSTVVDWEDAIGSDAGIRRRIRVEEKMYRVARRAAGMMPRAHTGAMARISSARRLSQSRVDAANTFLSRAACVVTDRLHAHLLAVLLGRSTIVSDNNFGKVRAFYETWMEQLPTTAWVDDVSQVETALDRLVPR